MEKDMFIGTVSEAEAEGRLSEIYAGDRQSLGYIPNYARVFSLRPEVLDAWRAFQGSIRKNLRLRRYELVTMAAAMEMRCRYCILAHGTILLNNGVPLDQLRLILKDFREAGLEPAEVVMMEFARQVIRSASEVTRADVDALRSAGFTDLEIFDITMTATMRSFASKTFDALGARPDPAYRELAEELAGLLPDYAEPGR